MFVQVAVVLAGVDAAILLFDKEEWGCLRGVRGANFPTVKVLLKKVLSGFAFIRRERIDFSDFGSEGIIEIDFMIIGSRQWDMVSGFFGEYQGEGSEFRRKGLLRLCLFSSSG